MVKKNQVNKSGKQKSVKKKEKGKNVKRNFKKKKDTSRKKRIYNPYSCREFLQNAVDQLGWRTTGREVAMDIGCGCGGSTAVLLEVCPKLRRVVAFDVSADRISQASRIGPRDRVEYRVADIEDRSTLVEWKGRMPKIVSINCFCCVSDWDLGFGNLHYLLKPGGEAALVMMLPGYAFDDLMIAGVASHEIWGKYVLDVEIPECSSDFIQEYFSAYVRQHFLEPLGFEVLKCDMMQKTETFDSDEELKNILYLHFKMSLPACLREKFMDYLFERYMVLTKQKKGGRGIVHNFFEILVRKRV